MFFAFIDESGKPLPTENDDKPILNAVCVKDHDIKRVTQLLYAADIDCFGEAGNGENRKLKGKKWYTGGLLNEIILLTKFILKKLSKLYASLIFISLLL